MLTKLKNSRLFTQTVIPIITIGALLAYIGSSMLNALLLERFEAEQQQQLYSASRYIDQMFKNHYKLLFYLYGTDAKDFAKQNSISKKEILEKLSHLSLPNKDAIVIFSEDGSILFQSKHLQTQNDNQIEQNYIEHTFAFKPWKWQISYILDTTNIQEIAKSNHDFMVATLLIIVTLLSITLLGIFYIVVQKPLQTISLQLNNIIEGKYTQLSTNKLFGKEFRHLADHLNKVTRVIQTRESDAKAMLLLSQQNEAYIKDILDSQHDIIVINNSREIVDVNQSFFLFLTTIKI